MLLCKLLLVFCEVFFWQLLFKWNCWQHWRSWTNSSHRCPLVVGMLNISKCWIRATLRVKCFLGHLSLLDIIKSLPVQPSGNDFVTDMNLNCIYIKIQPTRSQMWHIYNCSHTSLSTHCPTLTSVFISVNCWALRQDVESRRNSLPFYLYIHKSFCPRHYFSCVKRSICLFC